MKTIIGLTGPSGSGKTSLYSSAKDSGFFVINCDEVAHKLYERDSVAELLSSVFGEDILQNGKVDRVALAKKVFAEKSSIELLNKTVLPLIIEEIKVKIDNSAQDKILLDAPTLFESGADKMCCKTVGVLADRSIRLERIILRDGIESEAAQRRISAEKSDDFYIQNCDFVIYNNGSTDELINNFEEVLKNILGGSNNGKGKNGRT